MTEQKTNSGMEITSTDLLVCPFCGATPEVKHIGNEYVKKQVCEITCTTPGCFACQRVGILNGCGHTYGWAEQKCRERWNTRHANEPGQPRGRLYRGYRLINHGYYPPDRCVWWEAENLVTGEADFRATTRRQLKAEIDSANAKQ